LNPLENINEYFSRLVTTPSEIVIAAHHNPDGDTIGASLALYHFLKAHRHHVEVLVPNDPPAFLQWMPGSDAIVVYQSDSVKGNQLLARADIVFCVDFNACSRVKFFSEQLLASQATKILIDHHPHPENEFDISLSVVEVSSTSELVFSLLESSGFAGSVTREIAECLFVGIMTDTGSFSYSCNRPETFRIAAKLIEAGVDVEKVHRLVYDTYSESRMRLLGLCLGDRLKVLPEFSTAYIWLTRDDLQNFNYQPGDTEGVVNYALSIRNISLAALFIERDDRVRISLRSKGNFSVNELARNHFKGGGHKNAAGADSFDSMDVTLARFEELLIHYKKELILNLTTYY